MTENACPRSSEQSNQEIAPVVDNAPVQVRVGFDPVDNLPLATTVSGLCAVAGKHAIATATEIAEQGRGAAACRRLLARDIVICRSELRYYQALRSTIANRFVEGREGPARLRLLEQIVDNAHRRLLSSLAALGLEGGSSVVRVTAHQALVLNDRSG